VYLPRYCCTYIHTVCCLWYLHGELRGRLCYRLPRSIVYDLHYSYALLNYTILYCQAFAKLREAQSVTFETLDSYSATLILHQHENNR